MRHNPKAPRKSHHPLVQHKQSQPHNTSSLANVTMQSQSKHSKSLKHQKTQLEIKTNLTNAIKLLQTRLKLPVTENSKSSVLAMSQEIYTIVKDNLAEKPQNSQAPTMNSFTNSTNDLLNKKRSNSNFSSGQMMDYFKDKFGSPAKDVSLPLTQEEELEKKLRVIQALKRTQEIASRCSSHYNSSMQSTYDIGGKDVVVGKIKEKCKKKW